MQRLTSILRHVSAGRSLQSSVSIPVISKALHAPRRAHASGSGSGSMTVVSLPEPGPVDHFEVKNVPIPSPGDGEVRVRVNACGVCMRDVLDRTGAFPFINRPSILGHEIAGVIDAVGPSVDESRVGESVVSLHWASCGKCNACLEGRTTHCRDAWNSFLGLTTDGGYAEYTVCGASAWVPVPSEFTPAEASTIVCTYGTFWHGALTRGRLKPGERVLITGATGGVGSAAVQLAKALGCHVTAVTSSPDKIDYLKNLRYSPDPNSNNVGVDEIIVGDVSDKGDLKFHHRPELMDGVDVVFDAVGAPTFNSSLRVLRPGGRLVLVGNVTASSVSLSLGTPIVKGLEIIGSDSVSPVELQHLFRFMLSNNIRPFIQERLNLTDVARAHDLLEDKQVTGRIVLEMEPSWK